MLNLKIAELRKKHNLTQQELGDVLSVSYQTISKWENGIVMPDITMLPKLSRHFGVSTDALLGLVPLEEEYKPSNSGTKEYWADRVSYLKRTRASMWNYDYLEFLIQRVWQIEQPVNILDLGCGYGALGLMLLPFLPEGSHYTGVDFSEEMLAEARKIYAAEDYPAEFILDDILAFQSSVQYDLVISQAVLRHVNNAENYLQKMIALAKPDGLIVSMECNREFETDGLYLSGMDYASLCEHPGLSKLWQTELSKQNRDYSVAMKIPHYMKKYGLRDIACRMNDRVNFMEPEQEDYAENLLNTIQADHWTAEKTKEEFEQDISYFMNHGMSRGEAEDYCNQQNGIVRYLKEHAGAVAMTKFGGIMISYGWKL